MKPVRRLGADACLFDFDGCLSDSAKPIVFAMDATLSGRGLGGIDIDEMSPYIGPPLLLSMRTILSDRGADPGEATEVVDDYRERFEEIALDMVATFPGVPDLLEELSGKVRLGVVTSKPAVYARPLLDRLGFTDHFEFVEGGKLDETERKPDTLARALRKMGSGFDPARAIMIGDRRFDIEAALANGTHSIGVTWGFGDRAELEEAGASLIVDHPGAIASAVLV